MIATTTTVAAVTAVPQHRQQHYHCKHVFFYKENAHCLMTIQITSRPRFFGNENCLTTPAVYQTLRCYEWKSLGLLYRFVSSRLRYHFSYCVAPSILESLKKGWMSSVSPTWLFPNGRIWGKRYHKSIRSHGQKSKQTRTRPNQVLSLRF